MNRFIRLALFVLLMGTISAGCGESQKTDPSKARVKGRVTLKGSPYTGGGTIRFELASDPTQYAAVSLREDGSYEMPNAPIGENLVGVENESQLMMNPAAKSKQVSLKKWSVPKTSTLAFTVQNGENQKDFDLQ